MKEMSYTPLHTFAICAYKESVFLEECIQSLLNQTVKSSIIMVTSTPSDFLNRLVNQYDIPLYINNGDKGIVQDWNFAYSKVETPYLTIAHQDDLYFPEYTEKVMQHLTSAKKPLIAFSDYVEVRNGNIVTNNSLLKIKKMLLFPLRNKRFQSSIFIRRRILSLGSAICCPAVSFAKDNLPSPVFSVGFRSNEDWEAWERISKLKGQFIYLNEPLMGHRIHQESETSIIIGDNARSTEDYIMFCKFWPKPIAGLINKFYSKSENSNNL